MFSVRFAITRGFVQEHDFTTVIETLPEISIVAGNARADHIITQRVGAVFIEEHEGSICSPCLLLFGSSRFPPPPQPWN